MAQHPFNEHIPSLRRYAIALLRDRSLADDLVQDTLERGLKKFSLFRAGSDLRAWLFTIMHNLFINQIPRTQHWLQNAPPEDIHSGEELAEEMVTARDFMQAVQMLSAEQRAIILLIGLEQLSYEQAAQVLDLPVGTIMSRLARARERLRQLINGEAGPQLRRVK
ncbi:MAG: sigma-70 family RNA polymerase sigma factor [Gammaproteobacteria bacterium]|nr:sigma-70 family RNA polymerase sigma factor [Gammaproteobacteria bacterium]